ncbi:MAG: hypothetical protein H6Q90_1969 [Deltaproteobacteria bacterium]|nr:hypothetical protein [Deltaproteobacteria bacterium]
MRRIVHDRRMWFILGMLVLGACGAPSPVAVANRGGAVTASCPFQPKLELAARRYGNLDADQPDFQAWTPWQVRLELAGEPTGKPPLRGTLVMVGDKLDWKLEVTGRFDPVRCELTLTANSHEPINLQLHLGAATTGKIHSIDDVWLLGPPFPARR